jgi:hypothetical protein
MSAKERFQAMSSIFISHSAKDKATEISAPYPLRVEADRQEHRCLETQGQRPDLQGSASVRTHSSMSLHCAVVSPTIAQPKLIAGLPMSTTVTFIALLGVTVFVSIASDS